MQASLRQLTGMGAKMQDYTIQRWSFQTGKHVLEAILLCRHVSTVGCTYTYMYQDRIGTAKSVYALLIIL